jgi:iron complex outermembrane receptor protein
MALLAGAAAVAAGASRPALAQDAPAAVEEIVVRGQRREQASFDVPVQITALNERALEKANVLTLEDLQNRIPNTYFGGAGNYGGTTIAIRGVGGSVTVFGEDPVAVFFDDQFLSRGQGSNALLDLESIEVLRGPQGTLYGRNATAGAVLLRSARPDLGEARGQGRVRAAKYGEELYEFAYGTPLIDETLGVRVAGLYTERRGFAENLAKPGDHLDALETGRVRASLLWAPSPDTQLFALIEGAKGSSRVARARYSLSTDNSVRIPDAHLDQLKDRKFALDGRNYSEFADARAVISFKQVFRGFDFVAEAGYNYQDAVGETDSDGTRFNTLNNAGRFETILYTQDLRLVSNGHGQLDWVVGLSATEDRFQMPAFYIRNGVTNGNLGFFSSQNTRAYAAYAEGTYQVTGRVDVTLGVRATRERKKVAVDRQFRNLTTGAITVDPPLYTAAESWNNVSPRAIVKYAVSDDVNVYASVSRGFKGGGFNAFGPDPAYDPETITAYEAGAKLRLAGGRLNLNAAVFAYDYKDLQIRLGVPGGGVAIASAEGAEIRGVEVDFTFHLTEGLTVYGSGSLLGSEYKSFTTPDLRGVLVNAAGNRLSRAPEQQVSIGADYEWPVSDTLVARLSGSAQHTGAVAFIPTDQAGRAWRGDAYTEVDIRVAVGAADRNWEVSAFVQNATEAFVVTAIEAQANFPVASFNEPRKFGVELTTRF